MDIFSARLKFTREKSKLSQKEVAEMVGMSPQGYGKLELGTREPKLEVLAMFPSILNESTDFLLGVRDFDTKATRYYDEYIHLVTKIQMTINRINELKEEKLSADPNSGTTGMFFASNDHIVRIYLDGVSSDEDRKEKIKKRMLSYLETIPYISTETFDYINKRANETVEALINEHKKFKR
ncbi:helix-turn-helix domain-containing protein [Paenibacillus sp. LK1]|uniref:helix-turn-helix domain-containing protein n=1 Tax=Paenibacillus sp. LK1 TaxID=2053014 RepID=UPI0015D502C1|nr:helix-turn-helix transcriptional regulator [Paenibacillus sp. LK1]